MSTPTIEDRCAFGSWCPKKSHARLWCVATAVGSVPRYDGELLRMCALHGQKFAWWEGSGGGWTPDNQPVVTTGELAL